VESSLAHDRAVLADVLCARPADAAPVVLTHLSEDDDMPSEVVYKLARSRVAVVPTPERAARAIAWLARAELRFQSEGRAEVDRRGHTIGLDAIAGLLPGNFPWSSWITVTDLQSASKAVDRFGLPVAVKAAGRTISHRSDVGAVILVRSPPELAESYASVAAICARLGDDVVVQQGAPPGQEVLAAVLRDPEYGLAMILRPGGVLAELLDEQVVLWHGWTSAERLETLRKSRLGELLGGYRSLPPGSIPALHAVVESVLTALAGSPVDFLEFNPVVVTWDAVHVVDAIGTITQNGSQP
jgi:hypothetical protein